jgi:hypothetical protein
MLIYIIAYSLTGAREYIIYKNKNSKICFTSYEETGRNWQTFI